MELSYKEHVKAFDSHLKEIRECIEQERYEDFEPLCIDTRIHKKVLLSFGGPNIWIDFECDEDGMLIGASYEYRWGSGEQSYELSDEEAEELFHAYYLDC